MSDILPGPDSSEASSLEAPTPQASKRSISGSNPAPESAPSKPTVWQSLSEFEGKLTKDLAVSDGATPDVASFVGREFPTDDFDQMDLSLIHISEPTRPY